MYVLVITGLLHVLFCLHRFHNALSSAFLYFQLELSPVQVTHTYDAV